MALLSPRCPGLKSPLLREPRELGRWSFTGCSLAIHCLGKKKKKLKKALFFSLLHDVLSESSCVSFPALRVTNKIYFHLPVIHLPGTSSPFPSQLSPRAAPSSPPAPQHPDSPPVFYSPVIEGRNLTGSSRRNESRCVFS